MKIFLIIILSYMSVVYAQTEAERISSLKARWFNLGDSDALVRRKYPGVSNPLSKFYKMLSPEKSVEVEALMQQLEAEKLVYAAEVSAEGVLKAERINEIAQIKAAIQLIKDSGKPAWEKKILLRFVKDLK